MIDSTNPSQRVQHTCPVTRCRFARRTQPSTNPKMVVGNQLSRKKHFVEKHQTGARWQLRSKPPKTAGEMPRKKTRGNTTLRIRPAQSQTLPGSATAASLGIASRSHRSSRRNLRIAVQETRIPGIAARSHAQPATRLTPRIARPHKIEHTSFANPEPSRPAHASENCNERSGFRRISQR